MRVHIKSRIFTITITGEYHKMTARHVLESGEGREVSERAGLKDAACILCINGHNLNGPRLILLSW